MRRTLPLLVVLAACGNEQADTGVTLSGPAGDTATAELAASTDVTDPDVTARADLEPADLTPADIAPDAPDLPPDVAPDTADTAETATGCVVSADCKGAKDLCLKGQCVAQVACQSDKQCTALGLVCAADKGVCVPCTSAADCSKGESCKANQCLPPPASCLSSKDCKPGQVCDKTGKVCVECATAADCDKGFQCQETVCVPQACVPGAAKCQDSKALATCKPDGTGLDVKDCLPGQVCLGAECQTQACTPGNTYCDGTKVMQCDGTGTAPKVVQDCLAISKEKSTCDGGKCVAAPVGQSGWLLRGGFVTVPDTAGGGYRLSDQGFHHQSSCGQGFCLRGGFQP